jgi:hypothetical protein
MPTSAVYGRWLLIATGAAISDQNTVTSHRFEKWGGFSRPFFFLSAAKQRAEPETMKQSTTLDARFAYADPERKRFKLLDLKDGRGTDVYDRLCEHGVLYDDADALKITLAGKLGLEPANLDLRLLEDSSL